MMRTVRRLLLATLGTLALAGLIAESASAATATTQPATAVGVTSATLNGTVNTGGVAGSWQFQWGVSATYNKGTPVEPIGAGNTTPVNVHWTLTRLSPNTPYHFRLVVTNSNGTSIYPLGIVYGSDRTFRTQSTGSLTVVDSVKLQGRFALVPLGCVSKLACVGTFSITTRARLAASDKFAQVNCTTKSFRIKPRHTAVERTSVGKACLALLKHAPHHTITTKFTFRFRTGQRGLMKLVRLRL